MAKWLNFFLCLFSKGILFCKRSILKGRGRLYIVLILKKAMRVQCTWVVTKQTIWFWKICRYLAHMLRYSLTKREFISMTAIQNLALLWCWKISCWIWKGLLWWVISGLFNSIQMIVYDINKFIKNNKHYDSIAFINVFDCMMIIWLEFCIDCLNIELLFSK